MTGISEKREAARNREKSGNMHHVNDPESANQLSRQLTYLPALRMLSCPDLPGPYMKFRNSDQNETSKYAGSSQRALRADIPAVNRFEGTSSSKKVTKEHKIVG